MRSATVFCLLWAAPVWAAEPMVMHTPVSSAAADHPIPVLVKVRDSATLTHLLLHVRQADGRLEDIPFERSGPDAYEAVIPRGATAGTHLAYAIESKDRDGTVRAHFASREAPHGVDLYGRGESARMRDQLARYEGRRNTARVSSEVVAFGGRRVETEEGAVATDDYSDRWWELSAEYVFRPLTLLHDMRFRVGYMRAGFPEVDGERVIGGDSPGLIRGSGEVNLELHRWFSVGGRFILGANESGFVAGGAGIVRIGDIAGTHLAADIEGITDVGVRTDLRLHWATVPRFPMALGVTFTDWPDGRLPQSSTLLAYDLGVRLGESAQLGLRAGVANRPESVATGFVGGVSLQQSF